MKALQIKTSRALAVKILARVEKEEAYANIVLDNELRKVPSLKDRDKGLTTELVYGVLRWQKRLDWYLDQVCKIPVAKSPVWIRHILRVGAYQLLMLDKIPASAAINESVKLAETYKNSVKLPLKTAKGVINGILRELDRKRSTLRAPEQIVEISERLAVQYSFPEWMVQRWIQRLGAAHAEAACRIQNQPPLLTLRVNTLKTDIVTCRQALSSQTQNILPLPEGLPGLSISGYSGITNLTCYQNGECTAQNAASMLVSRILDPKPWENVLEACAGTGNKTTHIGELMENRGKITAVDLHAGKLKRLQENCQRMGISIVKTYQGDMTTSLDLPASHFQENRGFHRILVDAPCSGLGVLRKHPEAKWTTNESRIAELHRLQCQLLEHSAELLNPEHGTLVYSTCTTEPEETGDVISTFLQNHSDFQIEMPHDYLPESLHASITAEGYLCIDPPQEYYDGFFCARLVKHLG